LSKHQGGGDKYKVRRVDRFLYRTRYFTDAGIIGSKDFVGEAPVKWQIFYGALFVTCLPKRRHACANEAYKRSR